MTETRDILLLVLPAVTCTYTSTQPCTHTNLKSLHCHAGSPCPIPVRIYTLMHTHNSHLHRPVTQALCIHPHSTHPVYTHNCKQASKRTHTHTQSKGLDSASPMSLILPSPTNISLALQSPRSLPFPVAFLLHTQLTVLEGSQGER